MNSKLRKLDKTCAAPQAALGARRDSANCNLMTINNAAQSRQQNCNLMTFNNAAQSRQQNPQQLKCMQQCIGGERRNLDAS